MTGRMSTYLSLIIIAIVLVVPAPLVHAQAVGSTSAPQTRSTAKRVTWTIVGAAAGFGLGAWFGLHKFDDATNSDRKVWTSAILGAAAGGIAGGLLSRDIGGTPRIQPSSVPWPDRSPTLESIPLQTRSVVSDALRARIRALSVEITSPSDAALRRN